MKTAEIHAEAWVAGTAQSVQFTLGEETLSAPVTDGKAECTFKLENVHLWDGVNDPYLYKMRPRSIAAMPWSQFRLPHDCL